MHCLYFAEFDENYRYDRFFFVLSLSLYVHLNRIRLAGMNASASSFEMLFLVRSAEFVWSMFGWLEFFLFDLSL